jgi:hypothetical protein
VNAALERRETHPARQALLASLARNSSTPDYGPCNRNEFLASKRREEMGSKRGQSKRKKGSNLVIWSNSVMQHGMSRPLRIEYEGAGYHGAKRGQVFMILRSEGG